MAHTPGPWEWGEGWEELKDDPINPDEELSGPKYADLGLYGPQGKIILGLRIDHYHVEWDSPANLSDLTSADRALIAAAPTLLAACLNILEAEHDYLDVGQRRMLRAAIAKAEGGAA